MKKILNKIVTILMITVLVLGNCNITAKAADTASVKIGSATVSTGGEVSISVSVSSSSSILMTDLYLTYDSSVLEAVSGFDGGGGGSIRILSLESTLFTVKFKAVGTGTSAISVNSGASRISTAAEDAVAISASNGSVTVSAPVTYSSDNNLASLEISPGTLSPAFSPNVTSYNVSVDANCDKLTVSAKTSDKNASTKISGTRMDPGKNTTTITVTAQNGATKVYTINTTKAGSTESTAATEAPTTANGYDTGVKVEVEGVKYVIINDYSGIPLPEGFVQEDMEFNTYKILTGKNNANNLTIMYLVQENDTSSGGAFYIYDTLSKTFSILTVTTQPEMTYTILAINDGMEIPEGFSKSKATVNGNNVDVLLPSNTSTPNYFLFYGISSRETAAWYCYDNLEHTVQRYYGITPTGTSINTSNDKTQLTDETRIYQLTTLIAGIVAVFFIILSIILAVKRGKKTHHNDDDDYGDEEEYEEDYEESEEDDYDEEDDYEEDDKSVHELDEDNDFEFLDIEDLDDK